MHEWALAESVCAAAIEAAEKEQMKTITDITIQIGELQQIENDIFSFALEELKKSTKKLHQVTFHLGVEKSTLRCNQCSHEWLFEEMKKHLNDETAEDIHFIPEVAIVHTRCPKCKSADFNIVTGRGVSISSIKGEK